MLERLARRQGCDHALYLVHGASSDCAAETGITSAYAPSGRFDRTDDGAHAEIVRDVLFGDDVLRAAKKAFSVSPEQQRFVCPAQRVGRVVRVKNAGEPRARKRLHGIEHQQLILKIEVRLRLVENQHLRLGRQALLQSGPSALAAA